MTHYQSSGRNQQKPSTRPSSHPNQRPLNTKQRTQKRSRNEDAPAKLRRRRVKQKMPQREVTRKRPMVD